MFVTLVVFGAYGKEARVWMALALRSAFEIAFGGRAFISFLNELNQRVLRHSEWEGKGVSSGRLSEVGGGGFLGLRFGDTERGQRVPPGSGWLGRWRRGRDGRGVHDVDGD